MMKEIKVFRGCGLDDRHIYIVCPIIGLSKLINKCHSKSINCPHFEKYDFTGEQFTVLCNYEKKTLKDKITEVIKKNKIGTEFSEYGLEIFVDSIIDIIKEDK